jgi:hypothetical protein
MPYTMHRVFCGTPAELEDERQAFHDVLAEVNEAEGMALGILFVPVSILPNMANKVVYQPAVESNVRDCEFFVQVLLETWGPPNRNFETDYGLACRLKSDAACLMQGVAVFFKAADGREVEAGIVELKTSLQSEHDGAAHEFATLDEFKQQLRAQISKWLRTIEP